MASRDIQDCSVRLQNVWTQAVALWDDPEFTPFLTCTYRSNEEQNELYAQGRTKPGQVVTKARAGQSPHNKIPSEAFDIAFKKQDGSLSWSLSLFATFAKIVHSIDPEIVWGGKWRFKDNPHFEAPHWNV